jgi:hypothetical protein
MILWWFACGQEIQPVEIRPTATEPPPPSVLAQVWVVPQEGTAFPGPKPAAMTPPLAEGDGRDAVMGYCSVCHNTTYITMQPPLPPEKWKAVVDKMVKTFGAQIPDGDKDRIVAYLGAAYGPERR